MSTILQEIETQIARPQNLDHQVQHRHRPRSRRRRRQDRRPERRHAQRNDRVSRRPLRPRAEPRGNRSRLHPPRRFHRSEGRHRGQDHRPPAPGARGQGAARPRRERAWPARSTARGRSSPTSPIRWKKSRPGIIKRKSVSQPVQTGIMAIDAMIPIGRGQRELIIGDRATGKTTIAIDTIINQARINKANEGKAGFRPLYSHLRRHRAEELERRALHRDARSRPARCHTPSSFPPLLPIAPPPSISRPSPAPRWANGSWTTAWMPSLFSTIFPSTRSPIARFRWSSNAPPAARLIPGDVFYLHSRLLERSARVDEKNGNGSLTALPDHRDAGRRRFGLHPDERHLHHGRPDLSRNRSLLPGHPPRHFRRSLVSAASVPPRRSRR